MIEIATLPPQLHLSKLGDTEISKYDQIAFREELWKPRGGLWTCDLIGKDSSQWIEWIDENYPQWLDDRQRNVLQPPPARRILLDNEDAVRWLDERYGTPVPMLAALHEHTLSPTWRTLDWPRLKQDLDVITLDNGWFRSVQWASFDMHFKMWLIDWDVDTNLWLNWMFG